MSIIATLRQELTIRETLSTGVAGASQKTVVHSAFNRTENLHASSTVPGMAGFSVEVTLVAGTKTLDLTALVGTNGLALDATGLKLQAILIRNPTAHALNVAPGGSNPYPLFGSGNDVDIPAGASLLFYGADQLADVAAGAKTITFTGTGTDVHQVTFAFG